MHILGVVASNSAIYRLAQTYTSNATYTVPNGVYQISGIAIGRGGLASSGGSAGGSIGGFGGGGAGGGAIMGFWAFNVTPGETWNIGFSTGNTTIGKTTDGNAFIVAGCGQNASGATGGAGGLTSRGTSIASNQSINANGGTGGNGGAVKTTNGNGNTGSNGGSNSLWTPVGFPYSVAGLPTNLYSGSGGGGGGGGARDSTGSLFYYGGSGGSPNGGTGGNAEIDAFYLNGSNGGNGAGTYADGGGGGGGAAYQQFVGFGSPGSSGTSGTGVVYIYEK
jgi:hypothetical protein